jgi:hypothetical protein
LRNAVARMTHSFQKRRQGGRGALTAASPGRINAPDDSRWNRLQLLPVLAEETKGIGGKLPETLLRKANNNLSGRQRQ